LIINEVGLATVSDPENGDLDPLSAPLDPLFLFDVNNSGFVSPFDALLVINELPSSQPSAASSAVSSGLRPAAAASSITAPAINPMVVIAFEPENHIVHRLSPSRSAASTEPSQDTRSRLRPALKDLAMIELLGNSLLDSLSVSDSPSSRDPAVDLEAELVDMALAASL
jgi:hypothetical protein